MSLFDAHFHVIDPRFPLTPNQGYLPEPFTIADYRRRTAHLGVTGGAVVTASFQGFDQGYLTTALRELGPGFAGVAQIPAATTDPEIEALHAAGVRAVRFNVHRGGADALRDLEPLARRVHALAGWHAELYVKASDLPAGLAALPKVCLDHLGLTGQGLDDLRRLVAGGAHVKASGFGRFDGDVAEQLRALHAENPAALVFGTDLPSTRASRPFADADVELVRSALGDDGAKRVLESNAQALYGVALAG